MKLADVNVLVGAFRTDSSHHKRCRSWLTSTVNAPASFGLATQVLSGFIRVTTHPKVFVNPSPIDESIRFANFLLGRPNAIVVSPGERHWSIFTDLCRSGGIQGNLVPDAWFAALAIESGCEWVTLDGDFARFKDLNWSAP
ncbi:MAG: PIN domain-containing protein [Pseudomonadales bacterium]|nr:type II toxin-antitoxin system VapC family toxin [Pseudomonadales bacterium]NIX08556.1 PIN domain-containing protein [Pseudomonadales bacterium]